MRIPRAIEDADRVALKGGHSAELGVGTHSGCVVRLKLIQVLHTVSTATTSLVIHRTFRYHLTQKSR